MSLLRDAPKRFESDPETLGILFESLVVHELCVYAQSIRARGVFHLRDGKGCLEIDAIIESRSGDWIGVEAQLSHLSTDEVAANLLRVASHIERSPSALVIVIPSGPVIRRTDGVWMIPLAVLRPQLHIASALPRGIDLLVVCPSSHLRHHAWVFIEDGWSVVRF